MSRGTRAAALAAFIQEKGRTPSLRERAEILGALGNARQRAAAIAARPPAVITDPLNARCQYGSPDRDYRGPWLGEEDDPRCQEVVTVEHGQLAAIRWRRWPDGQWQERRFGARRPHFPPRSGDTANGPGRPGAAPPPTMGTQGAPVRAVPAPEPPQGEHAGRGGQVPPREPRQPSLPGENDGAGPTGTNPPGETINQAHEPTRTSRWDDRKTGGPQGGPFPCYTPPSAESEGRPPPRQGGPDGQRHQT